MEDSKLQILYFSKNFLYEEIIWQAKIYGGGGQMTLPPWHEGTSVCI